ncbi:polyprenyl synthetase family protein [Gordonia oryzae]|uniref:Polyprenyl synthetase family protein n=1 Tax=Gordonia oryzae TaxID=2487349 RepID=A0A3N4H226_9ACTN|nr:polyprenyl synthetase family protein [Gordonia oryzae]RPA64870.1 polyprenyl synthetase family protein [Gordonia oryzae]
MDSVREHPVCRAAETIRTCVDQMLLDTIDGHAAILVGVDPDVGSLVEAIRAAAMGGKRLRGQFCVWGARVAAEASGSTGSPSTPGVLNTATAIEMFHLAALIHDDFMDGSDTRRGVPTVHRSFTDRHVAEHLSGDAGTHGSAMAILAGDLCLTWSDELLGDAVADLDRATRSAVRSMWSTMRDEAFAGQTLDMLAQTRETVTRQRARTILRYKSAKYTISHPLRLGGALAGAPVPLLSQYDEIGVLAGEAFQLRDDVLGMFGDPAETGKPVIDDLREGKRTLLVALTQERASPAGRRLLTTSLGNPQVTVDDLLAVRELMVSTGALADTEDRIDDLTASAQEVIGRIEVDESTRARLRELVRQSVRRRS